MHTKTAVLNWLVSLLVPTHDVNSKVLQAEKWSSRFRTIFVNMSANASDCLVNTALEKAIMHKTWVRSGQYFMFIVTSVAARSFVLFHAARSLELLRMMLPRMRVGNFGVKKFCCPTASGSFHVKSTQKNPYPHRFEWNLVFTRWLLRY